MKRYLLKKWKQLSEEQQNDLLLNVTNLIDGSTGENVKNGECIVDFNCGLSVAGYVEIVNDEQVVHINSDAIIYDSEEGVVVENDKFKGLISLKDASIMFNKEESTLRRNIKNGFFKEWEDCIKFGTTWVFDIEALERKYKKEKELSDYWKNTQKNRSDNNE